MVVGSVERCQVVGSGPVLVAVCRQRLRLVEVRGNTRQGGRGVARGVLKSVGRGRGGRGSVAVGPARCAVVRRAVSRAD